jgi:PAS domain S-box-containing protein
VLFTTALKTFCLCSILQCEILFVNDYVNRRLGYRQGELDGISVLRVHPEDRREEVTRIVAEMLAGTKTHCPVPLRAKDGLLIAVETRVVPGQWNGQAALFGLSRDMTERVRAERQLEVARSEAEAASLAKSRFLATMSHEIRTPMNGILGMAQLLLMPELTTKERRDYAHTILASGQTLMLLLNDILDLSKVEAGRFEPEASVFCPGELLTQVQNLFAGAAKAKGLQLSGRWQGPAGQHYRGDVLRLRQMLSNLVGNALKFTPHGRVDIHARELVADAQGELLEFVVQDTGIGVAADKLHLLFQPFSQADSSTTRQFGGSGLGLSIVRSLASAMGGEVGVDSRASEGSRFWFRVRTERVQGAEPLLKAVGYGLEVGPAEPTNVPHVDGSLHGHVLIAEDNLVNAAVIAALLGKLGLTHTLVPDGQQAVTVLQQGLRPDLLLMDLHMPVMDGYTATQAIRQWEAGLQLPHLPIIALTADAFDEDRQHCLAVGMDDFLTKPLEWEVLQKVLRQWLKPGAEQRPADCPEPNADATPRSQVPAQRLNPVSETARAQAYQVMALLVPLLTQHKFDALDCFSRLLPLLGQTDLAVDVAALGQSINALSFDAALPLAIRLQQKLRAAAVLRDNKHTVPT